MTPQILSWLQTVKTRWAPAPANILDVGSLAVNGSPRSVWTECPRYVGIDLEAGPCVDHVANINDVQSDERFALVLCCECLEHDRTPMVTAATCRRFVVPGGVLVITTPASGFPEHRFPVDLWRFMPDAYGMFFDGLENLEVVAIEGPTMCGAARTGPTPDPPVTS